MGRLAAIHAAAFTVQRPWSAAEISDLAAAKGAVLVAEDHGFALGRAMFDEVELLTIAVDPAAHRQGIGARLLASFVTAAAAMGATRGFLEVAEDNLAAQALYRKAGWRVSGRRKGYYRDAQGAPLDAILMDITLVSAA